MAGLRQAHSSSRVERAYTRKSKFKNKSYVKAIPNSKLVRYDMGDGKKEFKYEIHLLPRKAIQIRHNALESSRQVVNRHLHWALGNDYFFKVRVHPHQILRENKMLTGAGADRMSQGMQLSFGRPVGIAARLKKMQSIFSVKVNKENIETAKKAMAKAPPRLPGKYLIEVEQIAK